MVSGHHLSLEALPEALYCQAWLGSNGFPLAQTPGTLGLDPSSNPAHALPVWRTAGSLRKTVSSLGPEAVSESPPQLPQSQAEPWVEKVPRDTVEHLGDVNR